MRLVIDLQGAQATNSTRGIGRYSRELALAMAREPRGHEILVVLNGALTETAASLQALFGEVLLHQQIKIWYPPNGVSWNKPSHMRTLAEHVRAEFLKSLKPDLVHVSSVFEGFESEAVTALPHEGLRLPVVATCYDLIPLIRSSDYFGKDVNHSRFSQWYYRYLQEISLCEGLLAISESSRQEAIEHLPFNHQRVFNIRAGISERFRPEILSLLERTELLRRYGLDGEFILFLGAGDIRKNEGGLLTAFAQLPASLQKRYQLLIVGASNEAELRRNALKLGVHDERLVFVPFVEERDLNALYSATDLFVFPSLHEGFGLPLAEAMACGAPAIASNTTSLPEVIGREDATFDPGDPASIAGTMRRVLEDDALRQELRSHGPAQAGCFTWQASADLAWSAMETIYDDMNVKYRVLDLEDTKRPSLAFVSPLPPQASGIADYSAELLPNLAKFYNITLVTEALIDNPRLSGAFPHLTPADFISRSANFDRVLYQIGNSEFHQFQVQSLLPVCPGVVVLHDAFLSNYFDWFMSRNSCPDRFREVLLHSHGYPALRVELTEGRDAAVSRYPCSLAVLENAVGLIQHSQHGRSVLEEHFGPVAVSNAEVVPLLRSQRRLPEREAARVALGIHAEEWVVCSFGGVTQLKCPVLLAEAWNLARSDGRMVFVGSIEHSLRKLVENPKTRITCTGRLTAVEYDLWLAAADVAVQWRTGSRGESSAAITDVLMAGLPTVVNLHGTAAELPDGVVVAMPDDASAAALAEMLIALRSDPLRRATLASAGRSYVADELSPAFAASRYRDAIEAAYSGIRRQVVVRQLEPKIRALSEFSGATQSAVQSLARTFPSSWVAAGQRRFLMDISELARRDYGSGIQRVVRELTRRILEKPPQGWRGEAVRVHAGHVRHTYSLPFQLLGHPQLELVEAPLDAKSGDVMLCADINGEVTDDEYNELRRLKISGTRIVVLVHDLLPMRNPELFPDGIAVVQKWYRRMLALADAAICTSEWGMGDLIAWLDENPRLRQTSLKIGFAHLGADFVPSPDSARLASLETGAVLNAMRLRPTVIMAGTIEPRKGHAQALAAFELLWSQKVDLGLAIIGKQGWQMDAFADQLKSRSQIEPKLNWLPRCSDDDLLRVYSAGSGFLMASNHEGFGLPIIEAGRMGLPVLARDLPIFREIGGKNVQYFQGQGAEDLAAALKHWKEVDFLPSSSGMPSFTWDETYEHICSLVIADRWPQIWNPRR